MKIKVKYCNIKVQKESFTIYSVKDEITGKIFDCFDELEEGKEYEGEVKENSNPQYSDTFKVKKDRKGFTKDYTFEKKKVALECAVNLCSSDKIPLEQLTQCRDKFFEYLK